MSAVVLIATTVAVAQRYYRSPYGNDRRPNRRGVPDWKVDKDFKDDVFTFVRVQYSSWGGWEKWATDYPDADLNFSYRLQQLTSMHVDPDGRIMRPLSSNRPR